MNTTVILSSRGTFTASISAAGVPLQAHRRSSDSRPFVAGVPGSRYIITVKNKHAGRLLLVASVDGRSVLDDELASWEKSRGMILRPGEAYRFRGFRLSDDETAAFVFGDPSASVSAQATGTTENVGVIGLAGFPEKPPAIHDPVHPPLQYPRRDSTWPAPGPYRMTRSSGPGGQSMSVTASSGPTYDQAPIPVASAGAAASLDYDLGTQLGEVQADKVTRASFSRQGITPDILVIGYATYESLREAGIISEPILPDRDPFPGDSRNETGYRGYLPR